MNRLFSEQEICKGCLSLGGENCEDCEYRLGAQDGATAQLAKTDKEWVEWIEKLPYEQFDNEGFPTEIDSRASHRCYLIGHNTLQERKRSIGL